MAGLELQAVALGQVGDDGVRVQLMNRLGRVMADSDPKAGDEYDSFKKLQAGNLTVDKGDYTLRVTRDKGQSDKDPKNYAMQVVMGNYSKDYDTVAKQPAKGSTGLTLTTGQQRPNEATAPLESLGLAADPSRQLPAAIPRDVPVVPARIGRARRGSVAFFHNARSAAVSWPT